MLPTRFTELVGCAIPLQQAGMGGVAKADLAVAVSAAGALGMIGGAGVGTAELSASFDAVADRTDAPVGINFLIPFVDPAAVEKVFGKPEATERLIALRDEFTRIENWNLETLESTLKNLAQKLGCKSGDLVHPARVAVSGRSVGPSLYHMLEVMGKERVLARFDRMIAQLGAK